MDDNRACGTQMRFQLKKINRHWFLEVDGNLHRLGVFKEAISVYMEDNVIFADDLMYQVKVKDSNEVNIVKIEDLCNKTDQVNAQQGNELPEEETNDSVDNISAVSDDLGNIVENFDETLEFGQEEYTSKDDENDADLKLQMTSEEVTGKNQFLISSELKLGEQLVKTAPDVPFTNLELRKTSLTFFDVLCTDMHTGTLGNRSVIIKQYKQDMINDFKREIDILTQLEHKNVINVLAVYTKEEPFLMVTDMMKLGTLLTYLRQDRGKETQMSDILDMTIQIAEGMAYLGDKNVVHRDVRANNILVCHGNRVKISGFHLARWMQNGVYYNLPDEKLPIKWTATEVLLESMSTELSDVWSFGVLLYELITFGGTPFPGKNNRETIDMLARGHRMEKPTEPWPCPQECYDIMLKCWDQNPSNRPTFSCLVWLFKQYALSEKKIGSLTGQRDMKDINEGEKKKGKKECAIM